MKKFDFYNCAREYVETIELIEKTTDPRILLELDEKRVICHNNFIAELTRRGISYRDREDVTRIAYRIVRFYDEF